MSEFVEKIIEEKGEKIKRETIETINKQAEAATARFNDLIEHLKEQAKIVLPVNVIDILAEGGYINSTIHNATSEENRIDLTIANKTLFYISRDRYGSSHPQISSGKYRVTLIMEKLGPADREP